MGHRPNMRRTRRGFAGGFVSEPNPVQEFLPPSGTATIVNAPLVSNGRRMTWEEALAQQMLEMTQPVVGTALMAGPVTPAEEAARAIPLHAQTTATVIVPAQGSEVTVVTFTVPRRLNGVIDRLSNQFIGGGWSEGSGSLIWRVEVDSVPVYGFHNMLASIGTMSNPADLGRGIPVSESQVVSLIARNVSVNVAGQVLLGQFRGNYFPVDSLQAQTQIEPLAVIEEQPPAVAAPPRTELPLWLLLLAAGVILLDE